nr:MAG: uracil-DNA glycosylase family protein [Candidatus Methanoperedens sp.]
MDIEKLYQINKEISQCEYILTKNPPCSRDISSKPLFMNPVITQRILLISRDPSNIANSNETLIGFKNTFFKNHVLSSFFRDYDKNIAKADENYFKKYSDKFYQLVYWTHYSKCYPGKTKTGHKPAKVFCSELYLNREIKAVSPDSVILMGKDVIEFLTKDSVINSISKNENNFLKINNINIPVICLTHPSNANNGCKSNPKYRFKETIEQIHANIEKY